MKKIVLLLLAALCFSLGQTQAIPTATSTDPATKTERALFSAGCFWKVQYNFSHVPGVIKTQVGYCGGDMKDPTYEQVCTDKTGHAETVEVIFDPTKIGYEKLLKVFFDKHDPTTLNRQGPDIGTQYRSMIFYTTPQQKLAALKYVDELERNKRFYAPISTKIEPAGTFYPAEEYHQDYYEKHGNVCF